MPAPARMRLKLSQHGDFKKDQVLGLMVGCGMVAGAGVGIFVATLWLCGLFLFSGISG